MSKHFTHLHLHTEYSLLDGAIRLPELVRFAKEQEWKAIGISDHGNIFGAVKFFQLAKKEGIKPVLGIEMYYTPDVSIKNAKQKYSHLILIVQNEIGYKNLCQLIAFSYQEGFYFKPRIDDARLAQYSEGLIATTACVGGYIPTMLRDGNIEEAERSASFFKKTFGPDRFFFELAPPTFDKQIITNQQLLEYGNKWDIKSIATSDAHYLNEHDKEAHEVLLAVQTKDVMSNPGRFSFGECKVYVRTTQEMLDIFPDNHDLIWNTGMIADSCNFEFEFGKLFFPQSPVPKNYTQESFFEHECHQGLQMLKDKNFIPHDHYALYDERLQEEMNLIKTMGFIGYFLVVSDFIKWAKEHGIPVGPGRGSVVGSLVAWTMKITNVDPIKYNLLFERFLNPERVSMPDIDIDFCIEGRELVINHVKDKYGHDNVCQIITFGTMMAKGVIKDVARALGFPFQDANAITDLIPNQLKITLKEAIELEPRLQEMIDSNPRVKELFTICFKLEGITRHASKHAAGLVISPEPLKKSLPLYIPPKTQDFVAQYAMTELESIGFLKIDFLGLTNLTIIDRTIKSIQKNHNVTIDLDMLPLDDKNVFELMSKGNTNAIFQFESEGIKEVFRKLKPSKFEDLIAVNALYRPGPLGAGGMIEDFIERRHGRQEVVYIFPELEPILSETYGVIVYQEQVMKIASVIGGYSLGGADILRKAMGKKKVEVMAEQRALFIAGAQARGFDTKKSGELFDLIAYFAGYGFNKAHATAYALIAYQTAYLKAHYPREFMASSITFSTGNPDQLTHYLQEASDMNLTLFQPNINTSDVEFSAQPDGILFGLQGIKNVGDAALASIIEKRTKKPFKDLLDFCKRVDLRCVNKRVIESLVYAGAMDTFPGNRPQKIAETEKIMRLAQQYQEQMITGQMGLFGGPMLDADNDPGYAYQPLADWAIKEKLTKEKEVAGFYLSSHPLKSYPSLKWLHVETFIQALEKLSNLKSIKEPFVACVGLKQSHRVITTKKGDRMAFAQLEDFSGHAEIIIFPRLYKNVENWLNDYDVFIVKGTLDIGSENKCKIKADSFVPIELLLQQPNALSSIVLDLPQTSNEELLNVLKETLTPGSLPLKINFDENGETLELQSSKKVNCTVEGLQAIEKHNIGITLVV